jgi:hypothetical protein
MRLLDVCIGAQQADLGAERGDLGLKMLDHFVANGGERMRQDLQQQILLLGELAGENIEAKKGALLWFSCSRSRPRSGV